MSDRPNRRGRPGRTALAYGMAVLLLITASALAGGLGRSAGAAATGGKATISQVTGGPWRQVFFDDFSDGVQSARWGEYLGQPGGNPDGYWHPSHVAASNGIARLETYRDSDLGNRWASGGMSSAVGLTQTYGRWEVRFRFDPGYGVGGVILLWPEEGWPPEIDIYENGGEITDRRGMSATLHYSPSNQTIQRYLPNTDFSAWHTVGVEWTPGRIVYLVDGSPWGSLTGSEVPDQPMWLAVQTATGRCGDHYAPCPDSSTPSKVVMEVELGQGLEVRPERHRAAAGRRPALYWAGQRREGAHDWDQDTPVAVPVDRQATGDPRSGPLLACLHGASRRPYQVGPCP